MRTCKKLLALLLALVMCVSQVPAVAFAEDEIVGEETEESIAAEVPKEESSDVPDIILEEEPAEHVHEYMFVEATEKMREHYICSGCEALFVEENGEYIEAAEDELIIIPKFDDTESVSMMLANSGTGIVDFGECGNALTWMLYDDNTMLIYGTGDMYNYTSSSRPWHSYLSNIASVSIESGVTSIGDYAFCGCASLTEVLIPEGTESIGSNAFYGCMLLESVSIPSSVTSIGQSAFSTCKALNSIILPSGISSIPNYAFFKCESLTDIVIPDAVTFIGDQAFYGCKQLTSVVIPAGVTNFGEQAFYSCASLKELIFTGNAPAISLNRLTDGSITAYYPCGNDSWTDEAKAQYGGSIIWVSEHAYENHICTFCGSLSSKNVKKTGNCGTKLKWSLYKDGTLAISGEGAMPNYGSGTNAPWYEYRQSITSIIIGNGLTSIGNWAFFDHDALKTVDFGNGELLLGGSVFDDCAGLESIHVPSNVIMDGTYNSGYDAFHDCSNLKTAVIDCACIGPFFFENDKALESVTFTNPDVQFYWLDNNSGHIFNTMSSNWGTIQIIGYECSMAKVFADKGQRPDEWPVLEFVNISGDPKTHTAVEDAAVPATCAETGLTAGSHCSHCGIVLTTQETLPMIAHNYVNHICSVCGAAEESNYIASGTCGENLTWVLTDDGVLTISGTGPMYKYGPSSDCVAFNAPWYDHQYTRYINSVIIGDGVTSIGDRAFYESESLSNIAIPSSVKCIGEYSFFDCRSLTSIEIPSSVTSIGEGAFSKCSSLTNVDIPLGITSIGDYVFFGCDSISSIGISSNVTSIGEWAFYGCNNLTSVEIPSSVTSIGEGAFFRCSNLTSIEIPSSVTSIGLIAFSGSINLTKILVDEDNLNYSSVDGVLFNKGKTELISYPAGKADTSYLIPFNVTSIGDRAFFYRDPQTLDNLPSGNLTSIEIPSSVTNIGDEAFYCDINLESIYFNGNVPSVGSDAFATYATVYYPANDDNWTTVAKQRFGEFVSWQSDKTRSVGKCGNNLTWSLVTSLGQLTISGTGPMYKYGPSSDCVALNAPWYDPQYIRYINSVIIGDGVTSIGDYTFWNLDELKQVDFGSGELLLGRCTFEECDGLESVHIPANVIMDGSYSSGYDAFHSCRNLKTAVVDCSYIGPFFFENDKALENITFTNPDVQFYWLDNNSGHIFNTMDTDWDTIRIVGYECSKAKVFVDKGQRPGWWPVLEFVNISGDSKTHSAVEDAAVPATCTETGLTAGSHCSHCGVVLMAQENIPALGHDYKSHVCSRCGKLEDGYIAAGTCGDNLTWDLSLAGVLTIKGTGSMANYTISSLAPWYIYRSKIKSVYVLPGPTDIGSFAFFGCSSLTNIEIPDSVMSIGGSAFSDCSSLEELTIPFVGKSRTEQKHLGFFFGARSYDNNSQCVPKSLKKISVTDSELIPFNAFFGCSSLTSIEMPDNVTSIGGYAFNGCSSLTSIVIPDSVTSIGHYAFKDCSSLMSIEIPDSVTTIEFGTFLDCRSLTSIEIPDSVTSIERYAFKGCNSLMSIEMPSSVTTIEEYALCGCSSLMSIEIPDSVMSIGGCAFEHCSSLTSIEIPNSVTSLGGSAFKGCSNLEELTIPFVGGSRTSNQYLGYIFGAGSYSFDSSYVPSSLKKLTVTDCESIPSQAFDGCSSLTSITIPDSVTSIGNYAFYGCSSLTSIEIPDSVTTIEVGAFNGCSSLTSIEIPDSVTSIGYIVFDGCSSLTSIEIPDSVTSIESYAFRGCNSLTSIEIPDSVTTIEEYAFCGCSGVKQISFEGTAPTTFGNNCFSGVTATVCYPAGDSSWTDTVKQNYGGNLSWHMFGDVTGATGGTTDGTVDIADVYAIRADIAGLTPMNEASRSAADVYRDGRVDLIDASFVMRYIVGLVNSLPII